MQSFQSYMAPKTTMGLGTLGGHPNRKFRWTLELSHDGRHVLPPTFVKAKSRPSLEVQEIDFLASRTWIAGHSQCQDLTVTVNGAKPDEGLFKPARRLVGLLKLWDGCGSLIEEWKMNDMFLTSVQQEYASGEEATIELTLKYSHVQYQSLTDPLAGKPFACVITDERRQEIKDKIAAYCPAAI